MSLERFDAETRTSAWPQRQAQGKPASATANGRTAVSARRDRANPIGFLAARYPVVRRLVTESSFRRAARRFILTDPPGVPIPDSFGDNFPRFIRSQGSLACIEYVAGVAELEMLRHKARHAPRRRPLAALALCSLPTERLMELRVVLHPSVGLVQSRFPIVTAWEINQTNDNQRMIERWIGEAAMVARPFRDVEVRRLPSGDCVFLRALSDGQTVATAAALATQTVPEFDVVSGLRLIEDARVVVGIYRS